MVKYANSGIHALANASISPMAMLPIAAAPSTPASMDAELISREAYLINGTLLPLLRFMAHRFRGYRAINDPRIKAVIAKLNDAVNKAMVSPTLIERYAANGVEPVRSTPEEFRALIRREVEKYAALAKCSQDTAHRDILALMEHGVLIRNPEGGRSTSYRLADPENVTD